MTEETQFLISRRRMLSLSAAAVLSHAGSALSASPTTSPVHYVSVTDYGAVSGIKTHTQAQANTEAFRKACASVLDDYLKLRSPRDIFVPAGDWFLSDGFTLPLGCTLRGAGMGATVLIIPPVFNAKPRPLITMGSTQNAFGKLVSSPQYSGAGVSETKFAQPSCVIKDICLYSGNGTGIEIETAGWMIQNVWLICLTGIVARHDGIISSIIVDSGSTTGVKFDGGQDILVDNFYAYNCVIGIEFSGNNNSIRLNNMQICFPRNSGVVFDPGAVSNNISFDGLSMISNAFYSTFVGGIQIQGTQTQLSVNNGSFTNLTGFAIYAGNAGSTDRIVLNNCTFDGLPPDNGLNNNQATAGGIIVGSIAMLEINSCRFFNLGHPALVTGVNPGVPKTSSHIIWNVGLIQNCSTSQTPIQINYQNVPIYVSLSNVTSLDGQPLLVYTSSRDAAFVTGRFVNCFALGAAKDIIWNSQNASTQVATRVAVS